jgi:dTDP-4-amino-4,6-dideoxygalactose transaminase
VIKIPFNRSNYSDNSLEYISNSIKSGHTSGDGQYTELCSSLIKNFINCKSVLITHSCTAALEMSAILLDAKIGDEVIMPSYTFVSTANAFVLRGLKPVFLDVRSDNCNINEKLIESAITKRTKAIVVVHYAGVACEMDTINDIAKKNNIKVFEDAAQAYGSYYKGRNLGSIGELSSISFHETKNIISGEGGALLINCENLIERSHIIREKGTNRTKFLNGQVDKYTWVDIGSSYLPSEIISAYLYSNLKIQNEIQGKRMKIWNLYYEALKNFQDKIVLPFINDYATNNGHMFYIRFSSKEIRNKFIFFMKENGIMTPFHYIPLHSSPAGIKYGRFVGDMKNTDYISDTLVRLPIFYNLEDNDLNFIIENIIKFIKKI